MSSNARLPPQLCLFEPECSSPTSTVPFRARTLVSHLDCAFPSPNAHLHVPLSPSARLPPQPCLFEPERSSPTSTVPFQRSSPCPSEPERSSLTPTVPFRARTLISHPTQFEHNYSCRTSSMRSRTRSLVSHLNRVPSSLSTRFPHRPCHFEPKRSSLTPTMSI